MLKKMIEYQLNWEKDKDIRCKTVDYQINVVIGKPSRQEREDLAVD